MTRRWHGRRAAAGLVLAVLGLSGCGSFHGIYSLPLPGAPGNGPHSYTVDVQLEDVLDLVPYSAVKVNGATVGHVVSIGLSGRHAVVRCVLPQTVHLPANSVARVAQTSLLGEKFVEIEPPVGTPPVGRLHDASVITLANTTTDATVEEVLGSLSLLLNGGGLQQVREIARELNVALGGREDATRATLSDLATFASGLNAQKAQIIAALQGVDHLSATVRAQESVFTSALARIPPALAVLDHDRAQLTTMLVAVQHLGTVAVHVVNASKADLLANLRDLQPTLTKLAEAGQFILPSFSGLFTYPTTDGVEQEYKGDYGNLDITVDVSSASLLNNFGLHAAPAAAVGAAKAHASAATRSPSAVPIGRRSGRIDRLLTGGLR